MVFRGERGRKVSLKSIKVAVTMGIISLTNLGAIVMGRSLPGGLSRKLPTLAVGRK